MTTDELVERVGAVLRESAPESPDLSLRIMGRLRRRPTGRPARPALWIGLAAGLAAAVAAGTVIGRRIDLEAAPATGAGKQVAFEVSVSAASRVSLVGDFNDWDRSGTPMTRDRRSGRWRATLALPAGIYRYGFLVDGVRWVLDPRRPPAVDDFGQPTALVTVE